MLSMEHRGAKECKDDKNGTEEREQSQGRGT